MKKLYIVLLLSLFSSLFTNVVLAQQCDDITVESLTNPGPFEVETLTEADGIRNGPDYFGATIYYPTNATPPFASIAIIPGYTALPSSIEEWGPFYASHGIVTIIIGTNSIFDFPEARAIALIDALETIKQENARVSSPLEGALNLEQLAVSGWSMGGGGAQRAAVLDNTIAGVVALCPWLPNPQLNHQIPVLIFSGEDDTVAPPSLHADIHYDITPNTTDKLLFEIANGNHSVANTPNGGNGSVGKIALSWLKLYVEENDCYCPLLTDNLLVNPPAASKVEQDFECELLGINEQELAIGLYPNPTNDSINIVNTSEIELEGIKIYDMYGRLIRKIAITNNNTQNINLSELSTGVYMLHIYNDQLNTVKRVIKN
tara:strand:+ start:618 stop:1739 length:1122 start_codon:yes stop_codon:yes gene_type:complete